MGQPILPFARLVKQPYDTFTGRDVDFSGTVWNPGDRILEVDLNHYPGHEDLVGFKIGQIFHDTRDFNQVELEEGMHYWWFSRQVFSGQWFEHMKREEAKNAKTPNLKDGETWGEAADKDKKDRGSAIWHFF